MSIDKRTCHSVLAVTSSVNSKTARLGGHRAAKHTLIKAEGPALSPRACAGIVARS
jgi:hypothetical protein